MSAQQELWPELTPRVRIHDIVRASDQTRFRGWAGTVVEIVHDEDEDGPIGVLFLGDKRGLSHWDQKDELVRFLPEELTPLPEWPVRELANELFGKDGYHSLYSFPNRTKWGDGCWAKGCTEKQIDSWTIVNYCGSIYPISYCYQHHAKWHGMCTEWFDIKKSA
ncbi:MAG: hypothetical protein ABI747_01235 [Candidatus Moraniibacteriota bacterium]